MAKERITHLLLRLFFLFRDCRCLSTVFISHFFYAHPNKQNNHRKKEGLTIIPIRESK